LIYTRLHIADTHFQTHGAPLSRDALFYIIFTSFGTVTTQKTC
jgi:hypothetical protein